MHCCLVLKLDVSWRLLWIVKGLLAWSAREWKEIEGGKENSSSVRDFEKNGRKGKLGKTKGWHVKGLVGVKFVFLEANGFSTGWRQIEANEASKEWKEETDSIESCHFFYKVFLLSFFAFWALSSCFGVWLLVFSVLVCDGETLLILSFFISWGKRRKGNCFAFWPSWHGTWRSAWLGLVCWLFSFLDSCSCCWHEGF